MKNENNKSSWWRPGLIMFTRVSALIAFPIIIALYVGKYLDNKYNTSPWIFLGLTFIAFIISITAIWKNISKYLDEIGEDTK